MNISSSNTSDDFSERLRLWRISQNFTQAEAARQLNIDRSYLSQVERGRIPGNALRTRFFLVEKTSSIKVQGTFRPSRGLRRLPVISWSQTLQTMDIHEISSTEGEAVPSDVADEKAFAVRLQGDAMEPRFSDGDIAILLPNATPANGDIVIANLKDEGLFCKIFHGHHDKSLVKLSSYNPAYPPTEHKRDDFHWIYPVMSIIRHVRRR